MNTDDQSSSKPSGRILSFRRGQKPPQPQDKDAAPDLAKYESDDQPDDYRHRMIVNLVVLGFIALLIGAGYWLFDTMASLRKDQDCVLSGRRNCSPIPVEIQQNRR